MLLNVENSRPFLEKFTECPNAYRSQAWLSKYYRYSRNSDHYIVLTIAHP
jgi:hypothetical protein